MNENEQNYLSGFEYAKDIGYAQYLDRKQDETRMYNCGGLLVELTLPGGVHRDWHRDIYGCVYMYGLDRKP